MIKILFKIVIVLMMTLNLYLNANNDFVSMYRMQGISAVEKELENSLKDMNYWKSYLEDKNVDLNGDGKLELYIENQSIAGCIAVLSLNDKKKMEYKIGLDLGE